MYSRGHNNNDNNNNNNCCYAGWLEFFIGFDLRASCLLFVRVKSIFEKNLAMSKKLWKPYNKNNNDDDNNNNSCHADWLEFVIGLDLSASCLLFVRVKSIFGLTGGGLAGIASVPGRS